MQNQHLGLNGKELQKKEDGMMELQSYRHYALLVYFIMAMAIVLPGLSTLTTTQH